MKHPIIIAASLMAILPLTAEAQMPGGGMQLGDNKATVKADTLPYTYKSFMAQPGLKKISGLLNSNNLALNVYQMGDHYCMEIPVKALGRDIMAVAMTYRGGDYVSPTSGVFRFSKGANKHLLYLTYNRSMDVQADSTDAKAENAAMLEALHASNMKPIDMSFTVLAMGKDNQSYIVDITGSVNSAQGLFDVSKNSNLSHPDMLRSQLLSITPVEGGVVFDLYRSQSDMVNVTMDTQAEMATTTSLKFILQLLPDRKERLKLNNPFYGFDTFARQEYDTKTYVSRRRQYVCRWDFSQGPIKVYINPITPKPFQQSIRKAFEEWVPALAAAGVKQPFVYTLDEADAAMAYHHLYVDWYGANDPTRSVVTDNMNGEILTARISLSDMGLDDRLLNYYVTSRNIDGRIAKDRQSLGVRQDMVQALMAGEIGKVLGLKQNDNGYYQFSPAQLRSKAWLQANGTTSSVTGNMTVNYLVQPGDGVPASCLFPKVSVYDREAIGYLYGKSVKTPSKEAGLFFQYDTKDYKTSWKNPKGYLSNNLVEAARLGIEQLKRLYPAISTDMQSLPDDQGSFYQQHSVILNTLGQYQTLLTNVTSLIGGKMTYPVQKGINMSPNQYPSKADQQRALDFINQEILHGVPAWTKQDRLTQIVGGDVDGMMRAIAVAMYKALLDADKVNNLISAEDESGSKAFTAKDLFAFIDKNLMCDYSKTTAVPEYVRLIQSNVLPDLADKVFQADISTALTNEGATMLHVWFVDLAQKVGELAESHPDKATRDNYKFIVMRLNRNYFDKQHQ